MEASTGYQADWNMNPTICRLCLHSDGFLLGIFNHLHGKEKNIYKKIIDCTALEISSSDGLPHTICHRCLFKLELCLDFRAQCFVSDSTLRQASRIAHAQRTNSSNEPSAEHAQISLMDLVPPQAGDSGDVVVVVDPSAVDYDSDFDSKYGRPESSEHYDQPSMAPNIGLYGHQMMLNHTGNDSRTAHDQIPSDNETNEIADNGGEIYDFRNVFMCRYCDRAFTDKVQCTRHEAEDHDPTEPYSCKTCQLTFPDRLHYSAHLKSLHADDKPYDCPECEKMFARRSDLRKHTIVHTGIKPFTCPVCSKSFSRNTNLSKHMRIHAGHKPFVCPRCPKTFITRGDLQRHSLIHSGRKPFSCRFCSLSFSRRDKLLRHEKRHFPAGVPADATGNNKVGNSNKNGGYSGENMVIDIDPIYTSGHETSAMIDYNAGMENKQQQQRLSPLGNTGVERNINENNSEGGSQFYEKGRNKKKKPQTKTDHVTGERNEPEKDEKAAEIERELTPLEKAAKSKRYPCLQCHRRFSNMEGLKFHISQHHNTTMNTSGRPFPCSQCPKGFMRKRELDRHTTTHSGMKPFSCTSCDKRFGRKDKLVRHMRIHDGSNLHVCPICTLAFTRKDSLWQHMRNHQREQQQSYHLSRSHNTAQSELLDSSSYEHAQSNLHKTPPKATNQTQDDLEDTLSGNSSNSAKINKVTAINDNTVNEYCAPNVADPDFIDTKMENEEDDDDYNDIDESKMTISNEEQANIVEYDSLIMTDKGKELTVERQDKERSSELDEDEDDDDEEEENDETSTQTQQTTNVVEIDDDVIENKDLIHDRHEDESVENRNALRNQPNSGDPDYDEDLDLDENDDDMMGEEEEDDEYGGQQQQQQQEDGATIQQERQQHQRAKQENEAEEEIIDCDANDSFGEEEEEEEDDSNQQQYGRQHGGQAQVRQEINDEQQAFVDDDLDEEDFEEDDNDDDDDDDVQMAAPSNSVSF